MLTVLGRLLERNSIYVATIFGGAFAFQGFRCCSEQMVGGTQQS